MDKKVIMQTLVNIAVIAAGVSLGLVAFEGVLKPRMNKKSAAAPYVPTAIEE
jgi:hypothetical protein